MMILSATLRAVFMSCVTTTLVTRGRSFTLRISSLMTSVMIGSRPVVGSS